MYWCGIYILWGQWIYLKRCNIINPNWSARMFERYWKRISRLKIVSKSEWFIHLIWEYKVYLWLNFEDKYLWRYPHYIYIVFQSFAAFAQFITSFRCRRSFFTSSSSAYWLDFSSVQEYVREPIYRDVLASFIDICLELKTTHFQKILSIWKFIWIL